jgi:transcriptional regulator with XRE-family HTH domain
MQNAGSRLRRTREQLCLKYRDVEEASRHIARERGNREFSIGLSRLADIENKGTVPSIYRLYSLCAIYGVDLGTVLQWYGIGLAEMAGDAARLGLQQTRPAEFEPSGRTQIEVPADFAAGLDLRRTSFVSRQIRRWGKLPAVLLNSLDLRAHRYAFVGTEDWSMHPIIRPGSFVQIEEAKRRIKREEPAHEHEKPIYFVEHRAGFRCGWCTEQDGFLIVQSHPASAVAPEIYKYPGEAEILGQIVGVAMRLDQARRRHTRS